MRIATWNVNSIRTRLGQVKAWLKEESPDLLCLQETKVDDPLFPEEELTEDPPPPPQAYKIIAKNKTINFII